MPPRSTWLVALTALACENTPHLASAPLDDPHPETCIVHVPDEGDLTFRDCIGLSWNHDVDVLFVVDDGPHALAMQQRLADALPGWIDAVLALDPAPNLRIGFTSSHDGNPGCPSHPGSGGRLVTRSCLEHPEDFVGEDGTDHFDEVCTARCELDRIDVMPTPTETDPASATRPWIDLGSRASNLVDPSTAVQSAVCASLLGASGCPLSAPMNVVDRVFDPDSPTFAEFHRLGATTVVVLVTGRPECSITADGELAFDPAGDRALWTDPEAAAPSPGTCHVAGVSCPEPDPSGEVACVPADIGTTGLPNEDHPVLVPVDDLWEIVETIDETNQGISPRATTSVLVLTGVLPGSDATAPPSYRLAAEPDPATGLPLQPGCQVDGTPLAPPVRAWALADLAPDGIMSIGSACADDYATSLESLLPAMEGGLHPICMPICVADVDEAPGLQVGCELLAQWPDGAGTLDELALPRCDGDLSDPRRPEEARGCWLPRTGDERRAACRDEGWNLEVELRWDGPFPPGGIIKPSCNWSDDKATDCPDLQ